PHPYGNSKILITKFKEKGSRTMQAIHRTAETSPLLYTRIAGLLYLILLAFGPFSMMYVPSTLIEPENATATASNILASESLFRMGMVAEVVIFLTEIVLTVVLYALFRPVSWSLALIATFSRL